MESAELQAAHQTTLLTHGKLNRPVSASCRWLFARLLLWFPVLRKTCWHSPSVYLLPWLLKLSVARQQNKWEENCAQIDPLFAQSSSKYRPEVAQHEWSEIWKEEQEHGAK